MNGVFDVDGVQCVLVCNASFPSGVPCTVYDLADFFRFVGQLTRHQQNGPVVCAETILRYSEGEREWHDVVVFYHWARNGMLHRAGTVLGTVSEQVQRPLLCAKLAVAAGVEPVPSPDVPDVFLVGGVEYRFTNGCQYAAETPEEELFLGCFVATVAEFRPLPLVNIGPTVRFLQDSGDFRAGYKLLCELEDKVLTCNEYLVRHDRVAVVTELLVWLGENGHVVKEVTP